MDNKSPQHDFNAEMSNKYPLLYRDMGGSPQQTCMAFGIGVGPGWFQIIEDLSADLEPQLQRIKEESEAMNFVCENCMRSKRWHWFFFLVGAVECFFRNLKRWPKMARFQLKRNIGWRKSTVTDYRPSLLNGVFVFPRWHKPCKVFRVQFPCAAQVKEKFGGLRFYMTTYDDAIEKRIDEAEKLSFKTCEDCGVPGKPRDGGWIRTLCDGCHEKK